MLAKASELKGWKALRFLERVFQKKRTRRISTEEFLEGRVLLDDVEEDVDVQGRGADASEVAAAACSPRSEPRGERQRGLALGEGEAGEGSGRTRSKRKGTTLAAVLQGLPGRRQTDIRYESLVSSSTDPLSQDPPQSRAHIDVPSEASRGVPTEAPTISAGPPQTAWNLPEVVPSCDAARTSTCAANLAGQAALFRLDEVKLPSQHEHSTGPRKAKKKLSNKHLVKIPAWELDEYRPVSLADDGKPEAAVDEDTDRCACFVDTQQTDLRSDGCATKGKKHKRINKVLIKFDKKYVSVAPYEALEDTSITVIGSGSVEEVPKVSRELKAKQKKMRRKRAAKKVGKTTWKACKKGWTWLTIGLRSYASTPGALDPSVLVQRYDSLGQRRNYNTHSNFTQRW